MADIEVRNKTVVLTGTFTTMKRDEARAALLAAGARVTDSISAKTDFLFFGVDAGSKLSKAESLNIPMYDEKALMKVLGGAAGEAPGPVAKQKKVENAGVAAFKGKVVVCTGTFTTMKRAEAEKALREAGATIGSGVTSKTDLLVVGEDAGSKLAKAKSLGVKAMTEAEMLAQLAGVASPGHASTAQPKPSGATVDDETLKALERGLLANRDDAAAWLVYADALLARNDPRGEVITLGARLREGKRDPILEARYAECCRAARWTRGAPFPKMLYRVRFEQLFAELKVHPGITVREAKIEKPQADVARWKAVAGAAWPEGMEDLYDELSGVSLEWKVEGVENVGGAIHIPSLSLWDHDALEDELWFDFSEEDHAFHFIRPIDRFVPEAYAVLYLRPEGKPAEVAYHYCGEELTLTGLSYREWLELLFRSRGTAYWLQLALGPSKGKTWVEEGIEHVAGLFRDFDPKSMSPRKRQQELDV